MIIFIGEKETLRSTEKADKNESETIFKSSENLICVKPFIDF